MVFRIYYDQIQKVILEYPSDHKRITEKVNHRYRTTIMEKVSDNAFPSEEHNVYLQQDGFFRQRSWYALLI
jgi:maltose phosphorylase